MFRVHSTLQGGGLLVGCGEVAENVLAYNIFNVLGAGVFRVNVGPVQPGIVTQSGWPGPRAFRARGRGVVDHPALGRGLRYEITPVEWGGDGQTADVIGLMRRYALEDAGSAVIKADVERAKAYRPDLPWHEAAYWWVKDRLRFTRDEQTARPVAAIEGLDAGDGNVVVETLIRPVDMASLPDGMREGDCDDYSMYLASLLTAMGYRVWFATLAASPDSTDYSHVYVVVRDGEGNRIPLDASHGGYPGWEAPEAGRGMRYREWAVNGGVGTWGVVILLAGVWWLCKYRQGQL